MGFCLVSDQGTQRHVKDVDLPLFFLRKRNSGGSTYFSGHNPDPYPDPILYVITLISLRLIEV